MDLNKLLKKINGGFASGNNNYLQKYTGNVAYYVGKQISKESKNKVIYFTCRNATFFINKDGFITWEDGEWLDGDFYGQFLNGVFWNGNLFGKIIGGKILNAKNLEEGKN